MALSPAVAHFLSPFLLLRWAMVVIREYRIEDKPCLEKICRVTDLNHLSDDLLFSLYLEPYLTLESAVVLVALVNGVSAGYILCAPDYEAWREHIEKSVVQKYRENVEETVCSYLPYKDTYPSHLHIDILPRYQRMGIGHMLMDELIARLKEKESGGLMLLVDPDNTKGVSFYKKYGFLSLDDGGSAFGLILS